MNRYLITGCGGYIGSHLAEFLLERGLTVYGMVHEDTGKLGNLSGRLNVIRCDILDKDRLESILTDVRPECIIHLAAHSSIPSSWIDPEKTFKVNILGTLNLLDSIRNIDIKPVIEVTGSSAEYGFTPRDGTPIKENRECQPTSPYAISKVAESRISYLYWQTYGMKIIRLRPFYIIGAGRESGACPEFARGIAEIEAGRRDSLKVGNLEAIRDPLDVRDVVRAMWLLAEKGKPGEAYNICSGTAYKIKDLLDKLISLSQRPVKVQTDPGRLRPSDEPFLVGDCSRLAELGWKPQIPLEQTLSDTLSYWRANIGK